MKTIKRFIRGECKGYNIRQTKDGKFHIYRGIVSQLPSGFHTIEQAEQVLRQHHMNLPNWNRKNEEH